MKRLLVFSGVYPLLALAVYLASGQPFMHIGWMLGFTYLFGILPGLMSGTVDAVLRAQPLYLRMAASAATGALMVMQEMMYFELSLSSGATFLTVSLVGGIPAVACSWLCKERATDLPLRA